MTSRLAGLVAAAVDRQEDPVRAAPVRLAQRHRRVDAEPPRLVARGRDDAARVLAAGAADDDRPAAQLRPVALLDRGEERVEVDVEDRPRGHARYHRPAVEPPADVPSRSRRPGHSGTAVVAIEPDAVLVALGRHPGGARGRLARAADRGRPRLAVPVLRPWLGRHPAGRPGPAAARCGRGGGRDQRLRLGPPRERRRAGRRVRAGLDHRRPCCWRSAVVVAGSVIDGSRHSPARPAPGSWPRCEPTRPAWIVAAATGLVVLVVLGATAGRRRPTAGSPAAGTGATSWSTWRSARASPPATSRPRSRTSPARR